MANSVKSKLHELFASYRQWIVKNPQLLSDVETTIKCLSFFSVGHFGNSSLSLEFIYSLPNLITLLNDMLLYRSKYAHPKVPEYESKLKIWLTVLEYTQSLLEVTGKKLAGELGRWLMIVAVQLLKTVLRLLLVYVYKECVTRNPPISPLNREKFNKTSNSLQSKEGFKLKRSGIVVRNIKNADPIEMRTWKALPSVADENQNYTNQGNISFKIAESLYVIKPLLYLGCVSVTSQQHWQPWVISLVADLVSSYIFIRRAQNKVFNEEERQELRRRNISLLLYILRSPFYEKYGCSKINALLDSVSTSVPITKFITNSLKTQLLYIEDMYFYKW